MYKGQEVIINGDKFIVEDFYKLPYVNNIYGQDAINKNKSYIPEIKRVIFNEPATIIFWEDGTKTIVKCEDEKYDPEKGFVMAIVKKVFGNTGSYYDIIKKWVGEDRLFPERAKIRL